MSALLHRQDEDGEGSPTVPYADGPLEVIPGVWIGSEDNARDWDALTRRGIKAILNVAKEVMTPFDEIVPEPPSGLSPAPTLERSAVPTADPTLYPEDLSVGRPAMHYLKMDWSHGEQNLVENGFPVAMAFVDKVLERGEGVLIQYVILRVFCVPGLTSL
jgi:tyrosine-protein phosphatase